MRLAAQEKGGYYPLPTEMIPLILSTISTNPNEKPLRILDPGCGTGIALNQIATGLNAVPYGNELHTDRATSAQELMGVSNVIQDDFLNIRTPKSAFNILYLNPPYDWHNEAGREEYRWLKLMRPLLAPGGLLIWIVPEKIMKDHNVRRYLASWFDDLTMYRFTEDTYDIFSQIVIYGVLRAKSQKADTAVLRNLTQLSKTGEHLTIHPLFDKPLYNPAAIKTARKFWFYGMTPSAESIELEVAKFGLETMPQFSTAITPQPLVELDPLTPMRVGHTASAIASGHINNQIIETKSGSVLIKGSVYVEPVTTVTQERLKDRVKTRSITVLDPRSVITTLGETGETSILQNEVLGEFLKDNIGPVTEKLQELYPPRYDFKLGEWAKHLQGVNPRRIPNTNRKGLLPAQKHSAVALCIQWERRREAILVGQVGTGKTVISVAAAYAEYHRDPRQTHFMVMCPPHLVSKWIEEVIATWPAAKAMSVQRVPDVDKFFATEGPIFGIMKSTSAGSAGGWTHSFFYGGGSVVMAKVKSAREPIEIIEAPEKVITAYNSIDGNEDYAKNWRPLRLSRITCPTCSAPVILKGKKNEHANMPATLDDFKAKKMACSKCNAPLWQDEKGSIKGRYPLATYIKRQYPNRIDILIVDEAHQYKGEFADRANAYGRMVRASKKTLAMTGTIYGGKASTLFFLLYRLSADFRHSWTDFTKSGTRRLMSTKWYKTYGVVEEMTSTTEITSSSNTGGTRSNKSVKEVAGSSPAMIPWLLNRSVFVGLNDMGIALPNFKEIVVEVGMDTEMADQYNILFQKLRAEVSARLVRGDRSLLSKYMNALIYWPDSPFRAKVVKDRDGKVLAAIPGTGRPVGTHPKEAAIIDLIKSELAEGRCSLLLVEQTRKLDIQLEWQEALQQEGINAVILRKGTTGRREWIAAQEKKGTQVIISNPKKVETGLDILSYPTIIWMAPCFSIYTVIQASGRAYRLGQTKDCKVYHFAYSETLQEKALRLVIAKSAAAKRVDGDTIDEDDMADLDSLASDSIINALAKIMSTPVTNEVLMTEINLEFEQAELGIYEGHFKDCTTYDEAKALYRTLAKDNHPDVTVEKSEKIVTSLSDLFEEANDKFKGESAYIGDADIQHDDDPEYADDPEPMTPADEEAYNFIFDDDPGPELPTIGNVEDKHERIVFGQTVITVKTRKRKVAQSSRQLSLF